jgi:hypothetical protein
MVAEGLLEVRTPQSYSIRNWSSRCVEAKKLGLELDEVMAAMEQHWRRLDGSTGWEESMSDDTLHTILRATDLSKRFGRTTVLDGMNMAVPRGRHLSFGRAERRGQEHDDADDGLM